MSSGNIAGQQGSESVKSLREWNWNERPLRTILLALILVVGAYLRISRLGDEPMRGDTIEYLRVCRMDVSVSDIYNDVKGIVGQALFPFPVAVHKGFLNLFGLEPNFFNVQVPAALWGIATIPVGYACGAILAGAPAGLILALLVAIHPYHVQLSREAYLYAPLMMGAFLGVWALLWAILQMEGKSRFTPKFYAAYVAGFFLLTHVNASSWALALFVALAVLGSAAVHAVRNRTPRRWIPLSVTGLSTLLVGLPVALSQSWGLRVMISSQYREHLPYDEKAKVFFEMGKVLRSWETYGWGHSGPRVAFACFILALFVCVCVARWRDRRYQSVVLLSGVVFFAALLARSWVGFPLNSRYMATIIPFCWLMIASGIVEFPRIPLWQRLACVPAARVISWAALIGAVALLAGPAYLSARLEGKPAPYWKIVHWVDANLPRGTPILVDRTFEPWNELRCHPASNVFFTSTVPNEPVDAFLGNRWRDSAVQFFDKYRDAAYLEMSKQYWDDPRVGPWAWPRQHFSRHVAFTNEPFFKLANLGLTFRGADRWTMAETYTNRVVVDLFYNLPEDTVRRAREAGEKTVVLYGAGWDYAKTQDMRDWRILRDRAVVNVYNLTAAPLSAEFRVEAVAAGRAKQVRSGKAVRTFGSKKVEVWRMAPAVLQPGRNEVVLDDPWWREGQVPLLVSDLRCAVEAAPAAPALP